jgi:hypothetical protein
MQKRLAPRGSVEVVRVYKGAIDVEECGTGG